MHFMQYALESQSAPPFFFSTGPPTHQRGGRGGTRGPHGPKKSMNRPKFM